MREKLKKQLLLNWLEDRLLEGGYGYSDHVESVLAMKPTAAERREIAELLATCHEKALVYTITGVMEQQPDRGYYDSLIQALDSPVRHKRFLAMRALLCGGYDGALEVLFEKPDVQTAMGDELPWELWDVSELPEPWQGRLLELFCDRYADDPPMTMQARQWLRMVATIPVTDERTADTLVRTWNRLSRGDHSNRFLVLLAMAAAPVPAYEPMLKKAARSRIPDIKLPAKDALSALNED